MYQDKRDKNRPEERGNRQADQPGSIVLDVSRLTQSERDEKAERDRQDPERWDGMS